MFNRLIVLKIFFIILSPSLYGSSAPVPNEPEKVVALVKAKFNKDIQNYSEATKKQELINMIIYYSYFDKQLNIDSDDSLALLKPLLLKGRCFVFNELKEIFDNCKSKKIQPNEDYTTALIKALYCLSWTPAEKEEKKIWGKKNVCIAHPDKGYIKNTDCRLAGQITEFLMNDQRNDLHQTVDEKEQSVLNLLNPPIHGPSPRDIFLLPIIDTIAGTIGAKFGQASMPSPTNQKINYILSRNFYLQNQINNMEMKITLSELSTKHSRRTNAT